MIKFRHAPADLPKVARRLGFVNMGKPNLTALARWLRVQGCPVVDATLNAWVSGRSSPSLRKWREVDDAIRRGMNGQ